MNLNHYEKRINSNVDIKEKMSVYCVAEVFAERLTH